ncbi:hypothetical protein ACF3N7_06670 [Cruoricaptor ignavus]|uniref:hypothetical protein n=1 Tax=Cruoricaptor ignavus TaxID=1118202 RepID=UPI00370D6C68
MELHHQILYLFLLAIPVACVSWTVTNERIFQEFREKCQHRSESSDNLPGKLFYYLPTCHYCFSHYVAIFFLILTKFKMLTDNWTGYLISGFAVVFVANSYITVYAILRQMLKVERLEGNLKDNEWREVKEEIND